MCILYKIYIKETQERHNGNTRTTQWQHIISITPSYFHILDTFTFLQSIHFWFICNIHLWHFYSSRAKYTRMTKECSHIMHAVVAMCLVRTQLHTRVCVRVRYLCVHTCRRLLFVVVVSTVVYWDCVSGFHVHHHVFA